MIINYLNFWKDLYGNVKIQNFFVLDYYKQYFQVKLHFLSECYNNRFYDTHEIFHHQSTENCELQSCKLSLHLQRDQTEREFSSHLFQRSNWKSCKLQAQQSENLGRIFRVIYKKFGDKICFFLIVTLHDCEEKYIFIGRFDDGEMGDDMNWNSCRSSLVTRHISNEKDWYAGEPLSSTELGNRRYPITKRKIQQSTINPVYFESLIFFCCFDNISESRIEDLKARENAKSKGGEWKISEKDKQVSKKVNKYSSREAWDHESKNQFEELNLLVE